MRYVLGPTFNAVFTTPVVAPAPILDPTAPSPAKQDVTVTLGKVDPIAWTVEIDIPAYTLDQHNLLKEIRVYLVPEGGTIPTDVDGYLASTHPRVSENTAEILDGGTDVIPLPQVAPGNHFGQILLGFDA